METGQMIIKSLRERHMGRNPIRDQNQIIFNLKYKVKLKLFKLICLNRKSKILYLSDI